MPGKRGQKRNLSPSHTSGNKAKRPRKATPSALDPDVIVIDSDSDSEPNDLKAILAQIKAQEESERLAHRMQYEFDQSSASHSKDMESLEDDEAMAKRLAEEWAHEDESTDLEKQKETCSLTDLDSSNPQGTSKSYVSVPVRPDEGLKPFRDIFTKTRLCSKCRKDVPSPRGCVSHIIETCYMRVTDQSLRDTTGYFFHITFATHVGTFTPRSMYTLPHQSL